MYDQRKGTAKDNLGLCLLFTFLEYCAEATFGFVVSVQ